MMTMEKRRKILDLLSYKDIRRIQWSKSQYAYINYNIDEHTINYAKLVSLKNKKVIPNEVDGVALMLVDIIRDIIWEDLLKYPQLAKTIKRIKNGIQE